MCFWFIFLCGNYNEFFKFHKWVTLLMYTMSAIHEHCKGTRMDRMKHTHQMLIGYSLFLEFQLLVIEVYGARKLWI